MKNFRNIAVLGGAGIGDLLTHIPLLRKLKKEFPNSNTTLITVKSYNLDLLRDCPYVDNIIEIKKQIALFEKIKLILKLKKFDLLIQPFPSSLKELIFFYLLRASRKLRYKQKRFPGKVMSDIKLDILKKIAIEINEKDRELELFYDLKKYKEYVGNVLNKFNIKRDNLIVCFHIGARKGSEHKLWYNADWAYIADKLIENYKAKIIFFGGKNDVLDTGEIIQLMKHKAYSLVGVTDIRQMAALIEKCALFICTNSGPMHIAAILKVPLVVISLASPTEWDPKTDKLIVLRPSKLLKKSRFFKKRQDYLKKTINKQDIIEVFKKFI